MLALLGSSSTLTLKQCQVISSSPFNFRVSEHLSCVFIRFKIRFEKGYQSPRYLSNPEQMGNCRQFSQLVTILVFAGVVEVDSTMIVPFDVKTLESENFIKATSFDITKLLRAGI